MLNVDRLALDDQHIVKYDKTDSMHRQLLGMRGYGHYLRFYVIIALWKKDVRLAGPIAL